MTGLPGTIVLPMPLHGELERADLWGGCWMWICSAGMGRFEDGGLSRLLSRDTLLCCLAYVQWPWQCAWVRTHMRYPHTIINLHLYRGIREWYVCCVFSFSIQASVYLACLSLTDGRGVTETPGPWHTRPCKAISMSMSIPPRYLRYYLRKKKNYYGGLNPRMRVPE